jgi:hypothetical protein
MEAPTKGILLVEGGPVEVQVYTFKRKVIALDLSEPHGGKRLYLTPNEARILAAELVKHAEVVERYLTEDLAKGK